MSSWWWWSHISSSWWWYHLSSWVLSISFCRDPWCCDLHVVSISRRQVIRGPIASCIRCSIHITTATGASFDLDVLTWTDVLACAVSGWTVGHFSCHLNTWPIGWEVFLPAVDHAGIMGVRIDIASEVGSISLDIRLGPCLISLCLFGADVGMSRPLHISVRLPE